MNRDSQREGRGRTVDNRTVSEVVSDFHNRQVNRTDAMGTRLLGISQEIGDSGN